MQTPLLGEEQSFYDANKDDLLHKYANRHLLIKGSKVIGDFSTRDQAVGEGVRQFGRDPFLVRLSGQDMPEFTVPVLALGVPCQS